MNIHHPELSAEELRTTIDPETLPFEDTSSLDPPRDKVLGQKRATDALLFGMGMKTDGYHVYIAGPRKTGLTYIAKTYVEEQAKKDPTPPDWCYVYNFKEPDRPKAIKLSPGMGKSLKKDMEEVVESIKSSVTELFDSDEFKAKGKEVENQYESRKKQLIDDLSRQCKEEGFLLQVSQAGMVIVPTTSEGQPLSQEDLSKMTKEEKDALRQKGDMLQDRMKQIAKRIKEMEKEMKKAKEEIKKKTSLSVVQQAMEGLFEKYRDEKDVMEYLEDVKGDIVENIDDFTKKPESAHPGIPIVPLLSKETVLKRYEVNVLVDNSETKGAPVIIESNPIYPNLFGTIERQALFGALFTDFTMIKPGVLHKANGGYLIMKALDLLKWFLSWEALKRALRDKEIKIEDIGELYGLFSTRTIRPQPIPLNIKIVLTGDPLLFELLHLYDDHFHKLFRVKADMDFSIENNRDTILEFAKVVGDFCTENSIRHLDRSGFARLIEYAMEKTEDRDKLTLEIGDVADLIKEANYYAGLEDSRLISGRHVEEAIDKRIFRSNLIEEKIRELIEKDIFWIETDGYKVGQINGISILMTGDYEFGKPNRITATVSVGREGVITIERESKMSGNIHTKGVMILSSFLKERFAHNKPLSITATLCFEQSYGMVEGDSASSTELFALLSAIGNVPIYQGIAVTGSVSQKGEIQAVGGVTRKIEAFYDICKHKGLNGKQGVIIPKKNVKNLMLKKEVIESVKEGKFHIWPISTVEEGIEILTGKKAGKLQEDGTYPEGTVFRMVDDRLKEFSDIVKEFSKEQREEKTQISD